MAVKRVKITKNTFKYVKTSGGSGKRTKSTSTTPRRRK